MDNQQLRLFDEAINKDIGAAMAQRGAQWSGSMDNNRIENLVRPWYLALAVQRQPRCGAARC